MPRRNKAAAKILPPAEWRVVVTAAAQADLVNIVRWTSEKFGARQAAAYGDMVIGAADRLRVGPDVRGARLRPDLAPDLYSLKVGRRGKSGKHFLVYRPVGGRVMEIVRILHESMDLARHLGQREA